MSTIIYFSENLGQMSHNVLDIRRFGGCDKGMRSIPATDKMWWNKNTQRA